jgi:hypothetical protein
MEPYLWMWLLITPLVLAVWQRVTVPRSRA